MRLFSAFVALSLLLLPTGGVQADASQATVARVEITGKRDQANVVVRGSFAIPSYSIRASDDAKQIVIEVEGAQLAPGGIDVEGTARLVVRSAASTTARGVRIELALTRPATYRARAAEGGIHVSLEAKGPHCTLAGHTVGEILQLGDPDYLDRDEDDAL